MSDFRWLRRNSRGAIGLVIGAALAAGACSRSSSGPGPTSDNRINPKTGTSASPRLFTEGQTIPKGGGTYKIGAPYKIGTRWYVPAEDPHYDRTGLASWYGADFHGRKTANGEVFDMNALTAAHPTLPIPSYAYVTNLSNNRTILVRINDRGPYAHDRVLDLSRRAARELGSEGAGVTQVRVKYAGRAPLGGNDAHEQKFLASLQGRGAPAFAAGPPMASGLAGTPSSVVVRSQPERAYDPPPTTQAAASQMPTGLTWRR